MNIHIVEQPEFSAVFSLPSPAVDHSGIGHLVEHLVFRTSYAFPEPHNLFVLTCLTGCKINASTTGNKSYYFTEAKTSEDLLLFIKYLYAGLMTRTYEEQDIEQEKSVIQHELDFYAKHPAYQKQSQIWRGDHHPDAYQHWGGFPDVLANLTAKDIYAYKSQYYQDDALSIYASGVTQEDINSVCVKVRSKDNQKQINNEQPYIYQAKSLSMVEEDEFTSNISSWWLPGQYQVSVLERFPIWQSQWPELYVEEELNHQGMFAIRYLCEESLHTFLAWFTCQTVTAQPQVTIMEQFPKSIQALLVNETSNRPVKTNPTSLSKKPNTAQNHQQDPIHAFTTPISKLIGIPYKSRLAKIPNNDYCTAESLNLTKLPSANQLDSPTIIKSFIKSVDFELGSCQPRIIAQLLDDMGNQDTLVKQDVWLIKISNVPPVTMTTICQTSAFWAPRVQGRLYTMGVFEQGKEFYVWGAGDSNPAENMTYIQALIRSSLN